MNAYVVWNFILREKFPVLREILSLIKLSSSICTLKTLKFSRINTTLILNIFSTQAVAEYAIAGAAKCCHKK